MSGKELEPEAITSGAWREADLMALLVCSTFPLHIPPQSIFILGSWLLIRLGFAEETTPDGFQKCPVHLARCSRHAGGIDHIFIPEASATRKRGVQVMGFAFSFPQKIKTRSAPSGLTEAPAAGGHVPGTPRPEGGR